MPAKTSKSRVSNSVAKKAGFQFRWWMALVLVVAVAIVGVVVLRFSNAASFTSTPQQATVVGYNQANNYACGIEPRGLNRAYSNNQYDCLEVRFPNNFTASVTPWFIASSGIVIWKIRSTVNTDCGTLSERSPLDAKVADPGYFGAYSAGVGNVATSATKKTLPDNGQTVWWTKTTCSIN